MFHFHVKTQILIIPPESIKTVGAGRDDLLYAKPLNLLNIFGSHGLVDILVTQFSLGFSAAFFILAKDAHFDPGCVADLDKVAGNFLIPLVEGGIATGKVKDIHGRVIRHAGDVQPVGPVTPAGECETEGIAIDLGVVNRSHDLTTRELTLHENQMPSHFQNLIDMLYVGRADLLAGITGGACPKDVLCDSVDQIRVRVQKGNLPDLLDNLHGRQGLVGGPSRTTVLAAFTTGAGVSVEDILPGEISQFCHAKVISIRSFEVNAWEGCPSRSSLQIDN